MKSIILSFVVCVLFHCSVLAANESRIRVRASAPTPFPQPLDESYSSDLKKAKRTPPPPPPPPYIPNFDIFMLSETWPAAFCKINTCASPIPAPIKFKIHGLWPSNITGQQPEQCSPGITVPTDIGILGSILNKLNSNWPSLIDSKDLIVIRNNKLWQHEWKKHGSCSYPLFTFREYFETGLNLYAKHDLMAILAREGIKPGKFVSKVDIVDAIYKHINFKPQIRCAQDTRNTNYLYEIRLCFTVSKTPQYVNCTAQYINCAIDQVYY
ncbi:ribonuclease S-F11-like [Cicer arietinum]